MVWGVLGGMSGKLVLGEAFMRGVRWRTYGGANGRGEGKRERE